MLSTFNFEALKDEIQNVVFAWRYHKSISAVLYKPAVVFKKFSFVHLLDANETCLCNSAKRFQRYLDPRTSEEMSSYAPAMAHVRTMDVNIIQHPQLKKAVTQGLNHIPLRPTSFRLCIDTALDAMQQLAVILGLHATNFPFQEAQQWVIQQCKERLRDGAKKNRYGFQYSGKDLLSCQNVVNEIEWLTQHLLCTGLDKAANNCSFICIKHIRLMALERLSSSDFQPCKDDMSWLLPTHMLEKIQVDLRNILPEIKIAHQALPYLMATYKQHKNKYRWITNAFQTCYSGIAHLITICNMLILESIKEWAAQTTRGYKNFLQADTSLFWIVNSAIDVTLNMPEKLSDIFVADITRCYESIPLEGEDNLQDALAHLIKLGYAQQKKYHPRSIPKIWVRINAEGEAARAIWSTTEPKSNTWFSIDTARLIHLNGWLIRNCFVGLGDRTWQQITGIPMGFACSPLWCNMYLLYYESQFIQRLARLGRSDLMGKFKYAYRYIDDLCWFNTSIPSHFLSPDQTRSPDNPWWIYPLNFLEIKCEISAYDPNQPQRGIQANFMNLTVRILEPGRNASTYSMCKYDKRRELPFEYAQYIRFHSNRPVKQSYNICIGQTVPIIYLSSSVELAYREILTLVNTLVRNGFQEKRLKESITKFLNTNSFPGARFSIPRLSQAVGSGVVM